METIFYKRVKELCALYGLHISDLGPFVGTAKNSHGNWKKTIPVGDTVLNIANYFHVTSDYLLGISDVQDFNGFGVSQESLSVLYACEKYKIDAKTAQIVIQLIEGIMAEK